MPCMQLGFVNINQAVGNVAARYVKFGAQKKILSADGVKKFDSDNPLEPFWTQRKNQLGSNWFKQKVFRSDLIEWMMSTEGGRAMLHDIKPEQDMTNGQSTQLVDDQLMRDVLDELVDEAKSQDARSSDAFKLTYAIMRAAAGATSGSAATRWQLNVAAAFLWHPRPRRVVASEDLGLEVLKRAFPQVEWVKVLQTLDYHQANAVVTRTGVKGADAKLHEAMLNYSERYGETIAISFHMSSPQYKLAKMGKLEYIVLIIFWKGLFVFDFLLIPVKSCLFGKKAVATTNEKTKYWIFRQAVQTGGQSEGGDEPPASRVITKMWQRHEWLLKFIHAFREAADSSPSAGKFIWFERYFGQKA